MKIKVNGLHIDVGDALRENVETTLPTSKPLNGWRSNCAAISAG